MLGTACGPAKGSKSSASDSTTTTAGHGSDEHDNERTQDLPAMTTAEATAKADRIALVTAGKATVVEGAPGTPFTRTEFAVAEVLKGTLPNSFVVQVIGGKLGDTSVESPVAPFVEERRYILFLGPDGPAGPTIIPQGTLHVSASGTVSPELSGLPLLAANTGKPITDSSKPALADVLFSIKQYIKTR
jgi:hypothetical protein